MSSQVITPEIVQAQPIEQTGKKRAKTLTHKPNGDFAKGNCGGPGRPRTVRIREAFEHILATEGADKYARVVTNIALKGKRQADRLQAVWGIRDTVEGKPVQAMLVGHVMDESSVRTIAELLGKLTVQPALDESDE